MANVGKAMFLAFISNLRLVDCSKIAYEEIQYEIWERIIIYLGK